LPTDRADGVRTARYAIQPITDSVRDIAGWPGAVRDDLIDALHRIAGDGGAADVVNCEADMAADHVLVDGGGGTWRVSGLLDFADARIGSPEWDVAAIWFWTLDEDLAAMLSFLRAYDRAGSLPDDIGTRCVLAGLEIEGSWWLEEHLGRAAAPTSLDDLQRRIMPFLDYLT
jgi:aminoglycoside phosphotransferase (APT) family kinase protein